MAFTADPCMAAVHCMAAVTADPSTADPYTADPSTAEACTADPSTADPCTAAVSVTMATTMTTTSVTGKGFKRCHIFSIHVNVYLNSLHLFYIKMISQLVLKATYL